MKTEHSSPTLPPEIEKLDHVWRQIWHELPNLVTYTRLCTEFGFKNSKSASAAICCDPDAPRPIFVGRVAMFPRTELVLWAANRSRNAHKRGCHARKMTDHEA